MERPEKQAGILQMHTVIRVFKHWACEDTVIQPRIKPQLSKSTFLECDGRRKRNSVANSIKNARSIFQIATYRFLQCLALE